MKEKMLKIISELESMKTNNEFDVYVGNKAYLVGTHLLLLNDIEDIMKDNDFEKARRILDLKNKYDEYYHDTIDKYEELSLLVKPDILGDVIEAEKLGLGR